MIERDIVRLEVEREIPRKVLKLARARERGKAHYALSRGWKLLIPVAVVLLLLLGPNFYNLVPSTIEGSERSIIFEKTSPERGAIFGPDFVIYTEELKGDISGIRNIGFNLSASGGAVHTPAYMEYGEGNLLNSLFLPDINPQNRMLYPGEYTFRAEASNSGNESDADTHTLSLGEYPGHNGTRLPSGKYFPVTYSGKTTLAAPIFDLAEGNISFKDIHPKLREVLETSSSDYYEISVQGNTYTRELENPSFVGANQFSNIELASPMFLHRFASFVSFSNSWKTDYQILNVTEDEFSASVGMESIIENTTVIGPDLLEFGLEYLSQYGEILGVPRNITNTQFFVNLTLDGINITPAHLYFYNQFLTGYPMMGIDLVGTRGRESDLEVISEIAPGFRLKVARKEADWDFAALYDSSVVSSFATAMGNTTEQDISEEVLYYLHMLRSFSSEEDAGLYQSYSFDFSWYLLQNGLNINYLNIKGLVLVIREYMADRGIVDSEDTAAYRAKVARALFNKALSSHEAYKDAVAWVSPFPGDDNRLYMFYPFNSTYSETYGDGSGSSGVFVCIADPSAEFDEDIDSVSSPPKRTFYSNYENMLPVSLTGKVKDMVRAEYEEMNRYVGEV